MPLSEQMISRVSNIPYISEEELFDGEIGQNLYKVPFESIWI